MIMRGFWRRGRCHEYLHVSKKSPPVVMRVPHTDVTISNAVVEIIDTVKSIRKKSMGILLKMDSRHFVS